MFHYGDGVWEEDGGQKQATRQEKATPQEKSNTTDVLIPLVGYDEFKAQVSRRK